MQKISQHFYKCGAYMLTSFCLGFSSFANPLSGNVYDGLRRVKSSSFADDQRNLSTDFVKSFVSVLDQASEKDTQQLSLDLGQEHISNG